MNPVFAINFRREIFLRERARARRRAVNLGLWLFYFGALGIVLGLYGLNALTLAGRATALERQAQQLLRRPAGEDWRPGAPELLLVGESIANSGRWRDRLARLAELVPPNARLSKLEFNPDNTSGAINPKLVVTGELRPGGGGDRMQQVMSFVDVLSRDSLFATGYANVRLVTTRAASSGEAAEFVIECR